MRNVHFVLIELFIVFSWKKNGHWNNFFNIVEHISHFNSEKVIYCTNQSLGTEEFYIMLR